MGIGLEICYKAVKCPVSRDHVCNGLVQNTKIPKGGGNGVVYPRCPLECYTLGTVYGARVLLLRGYGHLLKCYTLGPVRLQKPLKNKSFPKNKGKDSMVTNQNGSHFRPFFHQRTACSESYSDGGVQDTYGGEKKENDEVYPVPGVFLPSSWGLVAQFLVSSCLVPGGL